jgi:hypothetical protein
MSTLIYHFIYQSVLPEGDKEQWLAYLILKEKYPTLTYLSYDGYSCHGLADYSKNIYWQEEDIIDWKTKKTLARPHKHFVEHTTSEICAVWMQVNGETEETKRLWLESLLRKYNKAS